MDGVSEDFSGLPEYKTRGEKRAERVDRIWSERRSDPYRGHRTKVLVVGGFVLAIMLMGIAAVVFFVVYQQVENHLLQPVILSRTVKLNPLTVLIAILLAVEIAGILGALLAIPVAGMIQVILRDIWAHREGRPLKLPMRGEKTHETPVRAAGDGD